MKDVTKTLSERATRFLPVDMKDRLKSAFNRNSSNPAPDDQPAEDVPDYNAIFNARAAGNQKKPGNAGSLDQTHVPESNTSVTMSEPNRQIGNDHIEEAEIVPEASTPPTVSAESAPAGWEAASLKTTRKADALAQTRPAPATPEIANDAPDYSAIFKGSKPRPVESNGGHAHIDAVAPPPSAPVIPTVERKIEERQPTFAAELKPAVKAEATAASHLPNEEITQKPKPRFFSGDFNSNESVRLKVEKRDERLAAEAMATPAITPSAPQPGPSEPKLAELKARPEIRPVPPPTPAPQAQQVEMPKVEAPKEVHRAMPETAALRPTTSEQVNTNIHKENASMDAKGHESDNGAAIRTEGGTVAAIAIERNSKFSGQLKFSGAIAIDGQVEGELVAERVVVHEGGVVNATIEGNTVVIAGNVKGDVYARNELEILPSGVVTGSVTAPAINVRRGGRVEGRCAIGVPRQ